jgi:hypothetical protein
VDDDADGIGTRKKLRQLMAIIPLQAYLIAVILLTQLELKDI